MNLKWNHFNVELEASKYNRRIDFKRNSRGAYTYACKNKLMDKICGHMKLPNSNLNIKQVVEVPTICKKNWNYDLCKIEALKYSRRIDFRDGTPGAYYHALKHGFSDEICKHMKIIVKKSKKSKRKSFIEKRKDKVNNVINTAQKYDSLKEFRENDYNTYYSAKNLGIFDRATAHLSKTKHIKKEYSFNECYESAAKYGSKSYFKNNCYNQYNYAKSQNWIEQIFLIINLKKIINNNNSAIKDLEILNINLNSEMEINFLKLNNLKNINKNSEETIQNIYSLNKNNNKYLDIIQGNK